MKRTPFLLLGCCVIFFSLTYAQNLFPEFLTPTLHLQEKESFVVPFRLTEPSPQDLSFTLEIPESLDTAIRILKSPQILAGERLGFFRILTLKPANGMLRFPQSTLHLEIHATSRKLYSSLQRPQILGPVPGSVVWGKFAIGVEFFLKSTHQEPPHIRLKLSNSRWIEPFKQTRRYQGPFLLSHFQLNATDFETGDLSLIAVAQYPQETLESEPLSLMILHPNKNDCGFAECEEFTTGPRPNLYGPQHPPVGFDFTASNASYVMSYVPNPAWCFPIEIPQEAWYQFMLTGKGDMGGGIFPSVAIYYNQENRPLTGTLLVDSDWHRLPLGYPIKLESGSHTLTFFFMNDFFGRGITDRNLFLDTLEWVRLDHAPPEILQQVQARAKNRAPTMMMNSMEMIRMEMGNLSPQILRSNASPKTPKATPITEFCVTLEYPPTEHQTCFADTVIASIQAPHHFFETQLLIDGKPQSLENFSVPTVSSRVLFPLLLRNLAPGKHTLAVQIRDQSPLQEKNTLYTSETRTFYVLPFAEKQNLPYARAVYLLSRFAYGVEPELLAEILIHGEKAWLENAIKSPFTEDDLIKQLEQLYPDETQVNQIQLRAIHHLVLSQNPVQTRFALWTQNHFSTWIRKAGTLSEWNEYLAFNRLGVASFQELLFASASSPAMIYYLDQFRSFSNAINENYARELLELHTLGVHGGYTQSDVTATAQLLNGWMIADEANRQGSAFPMVRFFRHDPDLGQGELLRIFGLEFPKVGPDQYYDRILMMLEMLSSHPATARFISQKLAEHYVGTTPSETLVQELTQQFLTSGGDMKTLLLHIATHPDFWRNCHSLRLATPTDFTLRFARLAPDTFHLLHPQMLDCLRNSGMGLFDRITPDGYPEAEETYASANALLQRWKFLQQWVATLIPFLPKTWLTALEEDTQIQEATDFISIRLTGFPLNPASQEAVLKGLQQLPKVGKTRLEACLLLMGLLPEVQLR